MGRSIKSYRRLKIYSYPTRLPLASNREDLQFTVSIFDDDTGDPVNLSGIMVLKQANGLSNNNWTITDGNIVTTSSTNIFVPGYPINDQLLAVTLVTANVNLPILAGDPITIADTDGLVTLAGYVTSYAPSTGLLIVQVSINFQLEIRSVDERQWKDDYSPWYDWGGGPPPGGDHPIVLATLSKGLSIIDVGFLQVNIPVLLVQQLRHRSYQIALGATDGINTRQIFIGELPMLFGGLQTTPWMPSTAPASSIIVALPSIPGAATVLQRSVTSVPVVIQSTDQQLNLNLNTPTAITLPGYASRGGVPLIFKDVGQQATASPITINAAAGEFIDGSPSVTLNINGEAIELVPFSDGVNVGWAQV